MHWRISSSGGWAPYSSNSGIFKSSRKNIILFPAGGPSKSRFFFSSLVSNTSKESTTKVLLSVDKTFVCFLRQPLFLQRFSESFYQNWACKQLFTKQWTFSRFRQNSTLGIDVTPSKGEGVWCGKSDHQSHFLVRSTTISHLFCTAS